MQLETIHISNYRSINKVSLVDCGGFNVLIGKNNAGKSNILLAIDLFFQALRGGQPVVVQPKLTRASDHHSAKREQPIEITFDFRLSLAERDSVIQEIVADAPNVKNTVEGMDADLRLAATISLVSTPTAFAYVKQLALHKDRLSTPGAFDGSVRILLKVDDKAALELAKRGEEAFSREQDAKYIRELLERFDRISTGEWERVRNEPRMLRMAYYESAGSSLSADTQRKIEQLTRGSETAAAFKEAADTLSRSLSQEAKASAAMELSNRIETISGKESAIPPYALRLIARLSQLKVLFLKERREPIGPREAAQLLELKVTRGGPEKLRAIQETVEALLGVEIDAFKGPGRGDSGAELDVDRFVVQVNGAGIREALRLILDYEFSQPDVLLVEEPEVHLHPALETSMMRYLKRTGRECQIFITTHSTNFLDTAEMRNVYLAAKGESTQVQLINLAEAESAIPRELGIRLSSLFMFDKLVFVEGPSDEDVLRELASVADVNLAQASVGFVPMGGVRNLANFATEQTISFLTRRRVLMWFVLDRDERDNEEIQRIKQLLGDRAILSVLSRREIENYLIVSRPLCEFIKLKRQLGNITTGNEPTDNGVADAIQSSAEKLKPRVLERRMAHWACKPWYLNRAMLLDGNTGAPIEARVVGQFDELIKKATEKRDGVKDTVVAQQKVLDERWGSDKVSLVPGDELLDEVCKQFGVRFYKEKDSARLAGLMKKSEVQTDIRNLLEDIRDHELAD